MLQNAQTTQTSHDQQESGSQEVLLAGTCGLEPS